MTMALQGLTTDRRLAPAGARVAASTRRSSTRTTRRTSPPRPRRRSARSCPVREACLEHALAVREKHGVWGGLTERERRRVIRRVAAAPESARRSVRDAPRRPSRPPCDAGVPVAAGSASVAGARRCVAPAVATPRRSGASGAPASSPATRGSPGSVRATGGGYAVAPGAGASSRRPNGARRWTASTRSGTPRRSPASSGNMKGALMKLGQMVSYLDEGLPEHVRAALAQLQHDAPPMSGELAAAMVDRRSSARPPEERLRRVGPGADRGRVDRPGAPRDDARRATRSRSRCSTRASARRSSPTSATSACCSAGSVRCSRASSPARSSTSCGAASARSSTTSSRRGHQQQFADYYAGHPFIHVPRCSPS